MNNKKNFEFGFRIIWRIMELCYPPTASVDKTLLDLHNSSGDTKTEFNNYC